MPRWARARTHGRAGRPFVGGRTAGDKTGVSGRDRLASCPLIHVAGEGHVPKPSRVAIIAAAVALSAIGSIVPVRAAAPPAATPDAACHTGDRPETTQGRVPAADYA